MASQISQRYMMSASNNGATPTTLKDYIYNFKDNFLRKDVEIVPGLFFNQYETVKRVYFYIHNQFESGPTDETGNPKYFYDLITDRNDQSTKNIDLDTKDCYIKGEGSGAYLKSWLLRREFMGFAKESRFGMKLNELSDDLPDFGTVIWKKVKLADGTIDVQTVDLINVINDPGVKDLQDGPMIERHLMTQHEMKGMKAWDQTKVQAVIDAGNTVRRNQFMTTNQSQTNQSFNSVDESSAYYEVYEMWAEIPKWMYDRYKPGNEKIDPKPLGPSAPASFAKTGLNDNVYVMAIVANVDGGTEQIFYCEEVDRDMFPYKAVHYRRRKGRFMGVGNYEQCFALIEKANEVTNRAFSSLRIALLHLYQTRDKNYVKNVISDLIDGDVVVTKSSFDPVATEVRGFSEYVGELERIERKADKLCNSYEVVTGDSLPSGTPYKLGAQQLTSANLLFKYVRQNMALFVEDVFNSWLLPGFAAGLKEEHILDLLEDADDIEVYYSATRKIIQYETIKQYVLQTNTLPTSEQIQLVGALAKDQLIKGPKQVKMMQDYYGDMKYSVKMVIDGENDTKKENLETLSNTFQTVAANPAALQDPRLMKILGFILEQSGYSPLEINAVNQTETNPLLNPAMQGGAADTQRSSAGGVPATAGAGALPGRTG